MCAIDFLRNRGLRSPVRRRANQVESGLGLRGRVVLCGHLSGTPSGTLPLRWPARACPPAPKQTLPVKTTSREFPSRDLYFLRNWGDREENPGRGLLAYIARLFAPPSPTPKYDPDAPAPPEA